MERTSGETICCVEVDRRLNHLVQSLRSNFSALVARPALWAQLNQICEEIISTSQDTLGKAPHATDDSREETSAVKKRTEEIVEARLFGCIGKIVTDPDTQCKQVVLDTTWLLDFADEMSGLNAKLCSKKQGLMLMRRMQSAEREQSLQALAELLETLSEGRVDTRVIPQGRR